MPPPVRALVVGADLLARAGLAAVLAGEPELSVAGQAGAEDDLGIAQEAYHPDVIVLDLGWDPARALARLADLGGAGPPVVALLSDEAQAPAALGAGARGLSLRDVDATALSAVVIAVARGVLALDPRLDGLLATSRGGAPLPPGDGLTPRELEVVRLLAEGLPNKAIARRLGISDHTVKFHINAILGKLGAQSRTEAVTCAIRLGLIPL